MRPPALRNLRAFCVAARHLSFKAAADELALTPSAVSHQMKELEDTLGVRLFDRKTRALELTVAGRTLLEDVAPLLEAIDRSVAQIARRHRRRTLRLLLPPFFASELFVPRLGSFCAAQPDLDIHIETSDPRPSTHRPTADASILLSESEPQNLQVERLFSLKLVAVCAREHAATVSGLGRNVFREMALIVHKTRPFAWHNWAGEIGLEAPEPKNVIEVDTMFAAARAAERGVGIALVPAALCAAWFRSGSLVRIFPLELPTSDTYYLVNRFEDGDRPEIIALKHWVRAEFGALDER